MDRRSLLLGSGAALLGARQVLAAGAATNPGLPLGTREVATFAALPGKKPLIRLSDRPLNFETPLPALRTPITPNDEFFVRYHLVVLPSANDLKDWSLTIGGDAAGREVKLDLAALKRLPAAEVTAVCQCSGNRRGLFSPHVAGVQWGVGAMGCARWRGARLRDVLALAGVAPDALEVQFHGTDRGAITTTPIFRKSLPMARAMDENTLIAWEMNGSPLPLRNGFPARIVVPGWTATYWMKHVASIVISRKPEQGFWMQKAYRVPTGMFPSTIPFPSQANAQTTPITDIVVNALVTNLADGASVPADGFDVTGLAWDGGSGIREVEVSADGGRTWAKAMLGNDLGRFAFRPWHFRVAPVVPGTVDLRVRATANNRAVQPDTLKFNPAGYHDNVIQALSLAAA